MLHSKRLTMFIPESADFQRYFEINSDPETNLFNPAGPMNLVQAEQSFEKFLSHWQQHNFGSWTIRCEDQIVGFGGLSYRNYGHESKLNLGYRFAKEAWGRGYATELSLFAIEYGFTELNFNTIYAIVRPLHTASIKVLEKCGMQLSGTLDDVPGKEASLVFMLERQKS